MAPQPTGPEGVETSSHSNVVSFIDQSGKISSISYIDRSLMISAGQPAYPPPSIGQKDHIFTITLEAGRHKTGEVAFNFNNLSGGAEHEYAPVGGGGTPRELNFFFEVTIEIEGGAGSLNVYLGQGSFGTTNNWWIGRSSLSSSGEPQLEFVAGEKIVSLGLSGTQNTFVVRLASIRPLSPIKHVFVLMLENHSFDNMFAFSGIRDLNHATTADSNVYDGITYHVQGGALSSMPTDPGHEFPDVVAQLAGFGQTYPPGGHYPAINNSGFAANYATTTTEGPPPPAAAIGDIMQCFDTPRQLPVIYQLATQFAICDHWFSSLPGPTWPNRFFVHGASSVGLDHSPSIKEMLEWEEAWGFAYPSGSIYDALTAGSASFALFHDTHGPLSGSIPQVSAIRNVSVGDVRSLEEFVSDLQWPRGYPYEYTFIEPNYGDITDGSYEGGSSQHPMDGVAGGEQLIKTVYETIRRSAVWESSLLIITYDEHGGFYDHFKPPAAVAPGDGNPGKYTKYWFTFEQLGVRVPAVVVSPWIVPGTVDHTVYDHASVLASVEWLFGLNPLTQRDAKAHHVLHLISDKLRKDCPTALARPAPEPMRPAITAAQRMIIDQEPLPETGNLPGFLGIMRKTELELSAGTPAERVAIDAKFAAIKTRGDARVYIESVMAKAAAAKARRRLR